MKEDASISQLDTFVLPSSPAELQGWARVCYGESMVLFDAAHEGLEPFVGHELEPLGRNLLRNFDLRHLGFDLAALVFYGVDRAQGVTRPLVLPSEQALCRAFARWSLGPDSVDLFLAKTFDQIGDALARRHGHVAASELIEEAVDRFAPVRAEVLRRLITGPARLRPVVGPARYLSAPLLWMMVSALTAARQAVTEREARQVVLELLDRVGLDTSTLRLPRRRVRRAVLAGGLTLLGASLGTTALYHTVDAVAHYTRLLESVEDILLFGSTQDEPEQHYGPGLVPLVSLLDRWKP